MKNDNKLLSKIYDDTLHPTAKNLGETTNSVFGLILNPIKLLADKGNKKIENYFKRIDKEVPLENRVEADASISFPVLQHLALCEEKTIFNEMFFNILKSSVERNKKEFISPAFFELLKQLKR